MIAAASRASCARPYGTPWTRLLRPLATATPCTACPLLPKHTLRTTMKIPLLRPRLHQIRHATLAVPHESMKRSREVLFPFEAVIARYAIPSIEARLRSPHFHDASRWLCLQRHNQECGSLRPRLRSARGTQQNACSARRLRPEPSANGPDHKNGILRAIHRRAAVLRGLDPPSTTPAMQRRWDCAL